MSNFEIDTRAPLIVRGPGSPKRGRVCDRLVESVDVCPTLCELAGIPIPIQLEGTSFMPLLNDPHRIWKKAALRKTFRDGIWVASDGVPYMGRCMRTEQYR